MGNDASKFRITESVFRFGADMRVGNDPREAQLRMIHDGEALPLENALSLGDDQDKTMKTIKIRRLPAKARMAPRMNRYD